VGCQLTGPFNTNLPFRYTKALVSIKNLRKDRTAELKAEKERLLSLSREKSHSDKLKDRLANLNAQIAAKEVEYEESKQEYDSVAEANRKFYEYNTKFREIFVAVSTLEGQKATMKSTLAELASKLQEIPGNEVFVVVKRFLTSFKAVMMKLICA
jgi:DNA repair protein RAD50